MIDWEQYEETYGRGSTLYRRGREAMDKGSLEIAVQLFQESIAIDPHFKTLELLGECHLRSRHHIEAVVPLAAAAGLGAKPFRALYLLAQALHACGHTDWALEKLRQALELNPNYRHAKELLATLTAPSDLQR